jgi:hypothetical protein
MFHQRSICISNLPPSASEPDLFHYFGAYGAISSVSIVWDCSLEEKENAGARPRIAFVVMDEAEAAAAAITAPPTIHGRLLIVEYTVIEDVPVTTASVLPANVGSIVEPSSPPPPILLHPLSQAHLLAPSVQSLIVVGPEAVWQSASDAASILPLLHMLRVPDDAAARLLSHVGLDGALGLLSPTPAPSAQTATAAPASAALQQTSTSTTATASIERTATAATMEHLWTSHRPLQWFNPHALKSTLQLVGVKPSRAEAAVAWIFAVTRCFARAGALRVVTFDGDDPSFVLSRAKFSTLVRWALCKPQLQNPKPLIILLQVRWALCKCGFERGHNLIDFDISSNVRDGQCCVIILLGGTSGTGKSTLAALLSSKLGISKVGFPFLFLPPPPPPSTPSPRSQVLSTDFVRHLLRKVMSRESHPVLWGSTYNAAEHLPQPHANAPDTAAAKTAAVIAGYLEQSRLVEDQLFSVISSYVAAKRSLIVEGVHLTPALMCRLSTACPSCIPFAIYISNEHKHRERFAVRSKCEASPSRSDKM